MTNTNTYLERLEQDRSCSPKIESVADLLESIRIGDQAAAQKLWDEFNGHLIGLASRQLEKQKSQHIDAEDLAQLVFLNFFRGVQEGQFHFVSDRKELLNLFNRLLVRRTFELPPRSRTKYSIVSLEETEEILGKLPPPDVAAQVSEEMNLLLSSLSCPADRLLAILRMAGYRNHEIANLMGISVDIVEHKLIRIREVWSTQYRQMNI